LISGPLGQWIVNSRKLVTPGKNAVSTTTDANSLPDSLVDEGGFFDDLRNMFARPGQTLLHILVLLTCVKLGVFISVWVVEAGTPLVRSIPGVAQDYKLAFPTYMGAMILAVIVRNIHDAIGLKFLSSKHIDVISSFVLAWFLTAVMIALQLRELIDSAAAMLIIMAVQVGVMVIFARWVVFYVMGRDYEAAAMSSGMVGFGLGATSNALASIKALTLRFGPAPQAVIITSVVGAFLIDFINAIMITFGLNVFR